MVVGVALWLLELRCEGYVVVGACSPIGATRTCVRILHVMWLQYGGNPHLAFL